MERFEDSRAWSQAMFGSSELGDARRTKRLVDVGARLAERTGASLSKCCEGEAAALQGSYRLINNDEVAPEAIGRAGFEQVAGRTRAGSGVLLAVQDTSSVSYGHEVAGQLGPVGTKRQARHRGYLVHTTLLVDGDSERTVGLIDQCYWGRDEAAYGKKHDRKRRAYEDKESFKWQRACQSTQQRLGEAMSRTITVCDRESDIYEYLRYMQGQGHRFVTRAQADRSLMSGETTLFEALAGDQAWRYETTVAVAQRGGRVGRQAQVRVCARAVSLAAPADRGKEAAALTMNVVRVCEAERSGAAPLNWILLTSEPVDTVEQVRRIVRYYELRWRIEEFHKAWKTGAGAERQRMQSAANLQRMLVLTAFVAVRLLQLREHALAQPGPQAPEGCETVLDTEQWQVLWQIDQRSPPPASPPSARWACLAIAKLGGFTDTKRTGRPGWSTLWDGWLRLQDRIEGFRIARLMSAKM